MANNAIHKQQLLAGSLAKIERAEYHVNELCLKIEQYTAVNPFRLKVGQRNTPPERMIYIEAQPSTPDVLAMIIGDAVHNLRCALDHICFAMIEGTASNPKRIAFPFCTTEDALEDCIKSSQMSAAPKTVIDEIGLLRPYPSGNKYLHAINSLDNRDKHHRILVIGMGCELTLAQLKNLIRPGILA